MVNLESDFKKKLVAELKELLPGCKVITNNPGNSQGIPDILILHQNWWGMLELKRATNSTRQPNQGYFVKKYNDWSFASFIYPENKKEVLDALQRSFESRR